MTSVLGQFWIDHVHPFGLRPASSNSGQIGSAIQDIWLAKGIDAVAKYEDDFCNLRFPVESGPFHDGSHCYSLDVNSSKNFIAELKAPWHPVKSGDRYEDFTVFIGFLWDLITRRVSLPEKKRLKFLARVETLLAKGSSHTPVSLFNIQQIHGSLIHVAFVYVHGNSRLPAISNFMSKFENEHSQIHMSNSVISTLCWWRSELSDPSIFRQLCPLSALQDLGIFVDASTSWGIGIIVGQSWFSFQLVEGWKVPGRDIGWLEAVALEFLMYFLVQLGFQNVRLLIHSDNNGAIGAHSKGRSRNHAINICVRRTFGASATSFISPKFIYIASALNPSDPISRGDTGFPSSKRLRREFQVPDDLKPFFIDLDA